MRYATTAVATLAALALAGAAVAQPKTTPKPGTEQIRPVDEPDKMGYWQGSRLIGTKVKDAQGKNVGKIEDLMVDESGRVRYAVLSFGGLLGIGEKHFALPWNAMTFERDKDGRIDAVVLDVTKERLEKAPSFARDRWPDAGDRSWRDEVGRYWNDTAVTAAVKSRLAREKASTLAKIGVDTHQGVVELKGTVESQAMKDRATQVARQVEGVRQVVNSLKVQGS
jgi:hypothetical protein